MGLALFNLSAPHGVRKLSDYMTDDELIRAAAVGLSTPILALLIQKSQPYRSAAWRYVVTTLPYKLGRLYGKLWARRHKRI
jgi:hypothetical protein